MKPGMRIEAGTLNSHPAEVAKFAIIALAPGEHLAIHSQCHGVPAPGVHRHLLDHVLPQRDELARLGDVASADAEPQAAISGLTAGIQLAILGYYGDKSMTAWL